MRQRRHNCSTYRLSASRFRFSTMPKERARADTQSSTESEAYRIPENYNDPKFTPNKLKYSDRVMRHLRNIKNNILYGFHTIEDLFRHTFCCIMFRRTKNKAILKSVKI